MKKLCKLSIGICMSAVLLMGCGSSGNSSKNSDSARYVQAVLDVAYGKDVKEYVELTGEKEADVKKNAESSLAAEAKVMAAYFGMEEPSEDVLSTFEEICGLLYENASYSVEEKDGKVVVKIQPVTALQSDEVTEYVDNYNVKTFVDGEASDDETFAKGLLEAVKAGKTDTAKESKEVTVTVKEKGTSFTISDEDLMKIDEQIIAY